jgi:hypothetical protein
MPDVKKQQENSGDSIKCRCLHVSHLLFRNAIAKKLNAEGISTRNGKQFTTTGNQNILRRVYSESTMTNRRKTQSNS